MFYLLSIFTGVLIALSIALNGVLTEHYGVYLATVIIHMVGLLVIALIVLIKRINPFASKHPWYYYLGGAVGVATVVFINMAFGRISVSAILALGLLGQSVAGLIFDQYGWLGMPKHPFKRSKLIGILFILAGIAAMITGFEVLAVILAFASGVSIVIARTFNALLSEKTSAYTSTFYNNTVGVSVALLVFAILGRGELTGFSINPSWWIYTGGIVGVAIITLSNITVVKVSALYLSLLVFIGQVFTGVVIDIAISGEFSPRNLIGGALVTCGLVVNLLLDKKAAH